VDGDEQGTALTFTELRAERLGEAGYTAVALTGAALRSQVRQLAPKYDDIIIDVGGRDTGSLRAALTVADTLLVPVQPRSFDVWALDQVAALVAEAREINEGLRADRDPQRRGPAGRRQRGSLADDRRYRGDRGAAHVDRAPQGVSERGGRGQGRWWSNRRATPRQ
jgi:hypothetical protein